jgi:hypothetical protein
MLPVKRLVAARRRHGEEVGGMPALVKILDSKALFAVLLVVVCVAVVAARYLRARRRRAQTIAREVDRLRREISRREAIESGTGRIDG